MLVPMPTKGLFADLEWRGLIHQITDPALPAMLDEQVVGGYWGFDPSADSFTIGHLVGITMLIRLERWGHRPIALAGGATGLIGDPSFKADERPLISKEEVAHNIAGMRAQLGRYIDLDGGNGLLVDNSTWLGQFSMLEFLREVGKHFTVNSMMAKDAVRTRFNEREQGISYTEFSYPLLQAYDFDHLFTHENCQLQIGGSDQWGNITAGIDLIRRRHGATAYGLTHPLITKPDGTKYGKTESGAVWLDAGRTSPFALYQFWVRSEDAMVGTYLRYFTFRSREEITALDDSTREHPERREAQRAVAHDVVELVHGTDEVRRAERATEVLFSEDISELDEPTLLSVMADVPSSEVSRSALETMSILDLLVSSGLESSRGKARTTIQQGGAYLNNRKVGGEEAVLTRGDLLHDRYVVLRRGKANQHLVRVI
jgi:tyrosyl-tRNA synthetase